MANSSFFKSSGTSSTTESTIDTQVTNASTSATNAATSEANALTYKNAAETAKTAAETAQAASETAKTASETARDASVTAKTASESARDTASTHAGTATTKAGEALSSATSASGSATTATTQATLSTTQAGLSSDHRSDAGKYAVTNHNTTFSLSSTNGGTSGLYSAKHYATEAANSATSAANIVAGGINSISDVTITSVADNEILQYDNSSSKWINQTLAEAGILTSETFTSLVQDTSPQLGGTLDANSNTIDMGTNTITDAKVGQWDTAYGWGNHASGGYLTSQTSHADVVVDGDFGSNGIMTRTGAGSYAMLTDNSSNWNTAFGWGNHASAGYLTSLGTAIVDADFSSNGLMKRTGAGAYSIVTDNSSNWDTAFGWGNHASSNYLTANQTITLSGDVSGSGTTSITVTIADDSHNHTIANVDDLQTTLDAKAPLASPTLTGNPTAPTQSASDNSTKIATTAYADTAVSNLVDSAPSALNTLNELASALGDDANFSTTVTNSIATKAPLASPALTGNPTAPTQSASDNSTKIATTAYVDNQVATENTIDEMDDTTITSVGDNEILQYNNSTSKWENQTLAEAGILTANQTITLSGDVSGSGTTSISVTIADDSHNHTIANVDDLQTTLDAKAPLASPSLTGTPVAPTASGGTNTTQIATTAFVTSANSNKATKGFATAMAIAL